MSTFSTIGAVITGGAVMVAGIVGYESIPTPPSAIVVCESYATAPTNEMLAVQGCCLDGRTVRVIVANSSTLQAP